VQDQAAFPKLLRKAKRIMPTISRRWVDKGYTGQTVTGAAAKAGVTVDVMSGPTPGHGFVVQPRRWVPERTNGWINQRRRIDATTKPPSKHTKAFTSAKSLYYSGDSTATSCSTRIRPRLAVVSCVTAVNEFLLRRVPS
jgi:transposase